MLSHFILLFPPPLLLDPACSALPYAPLYNCSINLISSALLYIIIDEKMSDPSLNFV